MPGLVDESGLMLSGLSGFPRRARSCRRLAADTGTWERIRPLSFLGRSWICLGHAHNRLKLRPDSYLGYLDALYFADSRAVLKSRFTSPITLALQTLQGET